MSVLLATVVHDPTGKLLAKWESLVDAVLDAFDGIVASASGRGHQPTLDLLAAHGALVVHDDGPDGIATIGRGRRRSLLAALDGGCDHVVYADADHALRWAERHPGDVRAALAAIDQADFTVYGRSPDAFDEAPAPLRTTEALVNAFYERRTGRAWDLFIAIRGMGRPVARAIVDDCDEDTIGTDVAWPLFAESRGFSLAYREVPLVYETSTWYASGVSERERIEADPREWALRFDLGRQMFDAFDRWGAVRG